METEMTTQEAPDFSESAPTPTTIKPIRSRDEKADIPTIIAGGSSVAAVVCGVLGTVYAGIGVYKWAPSASEFATSGKFFAGYIGAAALALAIGHIKGRKASESSEELQDSYFSSAE